MPDRALHNYQFSPRDMGKLQAAVTEQVTDAGRKLLNGAEKDLRVFGEAIAKDGFQALLLPTLEREEVLKELAAQVRALGEINRIRANDAGWKVFTDVFEIVLKTTLGTALALL